MASIIERGGKFFARVRRQGYPCAAKTFHRRSDALAWAKSVEVDMDRGAWVAPADRVPTLADVIRQYQKDVAPAMKGAHVYARYFAEFSRQPFAVKLVTEVTPRDVAGWRDGQGDRLASSTIARMLSVLSSVFTWAMKERGWLDENPVSKIRRPKFRDARSRVLSDEEQRYLAAAARNSRARWLAPAVRVLVQSAMRRSELWGLLCRDVDFSNATAYLPDTKAGGSRTVPLAPDALEALRELVAMAPKGTGSRVIPVAYVNTVTDVFQTAVRQGRANYRGDCLRAGVEPATGFLEDVRLHDLRHMAVTYWASTGGLTLPELMAVSGHRSPRMLMRYTHLSPAGIAAKLATISARNAIASTASSTTQSEGIAA